MKLYSVTGVYLSLILLSGLSQAQQADVAQPAIKVEQPGQAGPQKPVTTRRPAATVQVDIRTTISGNQEQPRTLYVLPWQDSIAQIRIPAPGINVAQEPIQPLDRQQFLRFIQAQSLSQQPASTASTKNN